MVERRTIPVLVGISLSFLIFVPLSAQGGEASAGWCPAGYEAGAVNANGPGCTVCASQDAACEGVELFCIGPPLAICPPGPELEACCADTPCAENCPDPKPLRCSVSTCVCEPAECCKTNCPAPAPALGSPQSFNFLFAAAGLTAVGLFLVGRRSRRRQ